MTEIRKAHFVQERTKITAYVLGARLDGAERRIIGERGDRDAGNKLSFQYLDTLFDLLADQQYMGGKPGIIASLQTWTRTLLVHPHVHCLVTGSGLSPSGELKPAARDFLLPYDVLKDAFRARMRRTILKAFDRGELVLPEDMRSQQFKNLLNKLGLGWSVQKRPLKKNFEVRNLVLISIQQLFLMPKAIFSCQYALI